MAICATVSLGIGLETLLLLLQHLIDGCGPPLVTLNSHLQISRDTFEEFMAQDRHYPAAASKVYSQAMVKASGEGPAVFATVREMLEDCHEELSLHAHYTEVRARCRATPGTPD